MALARRIPTQGTDWLRFVNFKRLDHDHPLVDQTNGGTNLGGFMFQARFDNDGARGAVMKGDSGGPLFVRLPPSGPQAEWRVAGVASLFDCNTLSGTIQDLWARTPDPRNRNFIQRFAQNPDGTFIGDDVSTRGCASPQFSGDPNDPDCDGLLSEPLRPWQDRDNCPDDFNPDQLDADGDGIGNACDSLNSACR